LLCRLRKRAVLLDEFAEEPKLFRIEPPKPRIEAIRIVDMSTSNAWAEFAGILGSSHLEHETGQIELKFLMPEDAKEAIGYGIRANRLAMAAKARGGGPRSGSVDPSASLAAALA